MKTIDLELYKTAPENPRMCTYAGQRTAQEVFAELKQHLESIGMLPDEYFMLDHEWENGREIPKGAEVFPTVKYGGSEGIYIDIGLKWYEDNNRIITGFITGKTLADSDGALDRMYLTASAVNKAFYSHQPYARYICVGGDTPAQDTVLHLSEAERRLMIDSLLEHRNKLLNGTIATEHLLRRITGSITEFVNEVGARPLQISGYDTAVLAIQDGNSDTFYEIFRSVPDRAGELLVHAAGRAGKVGYSMTASLLTASNGIPCDVYLEACKSAISTGDTDRVLMMALKAEDCVADLDMGLYGELIGKCIQEHRNPMSRELLSQCSSEQIQAADPYVMVQAVNSGDRRIMESLAEKKLDVTNRASELIHALEYKRDGYMLEILLDRGMILDNGNLSALQACVRAGSKEMGEVLLDHGMDFAAYEQWAVNDAYASVTNDTFAALKQYWEEYIQTAESAPKEEPQDSQSM